MLIHYSTVLIVEPFVNVEKKYKSIALCLPYPSLVPTIRKDIVPTSLFCCAYCKT